MNPSSFCRAMLASAFATALLFHSGSSHAQQSGSPELISRAENFVDHLVAGELDEAASGFDKTMTKVMPAEKLGAVWAQLGKQAGAFKARHGARTVSLGSYQAVFVTCEFERAWLDAKVVFDQAGRIAGLFFLPGQQPSPPTSPYADPAKFSETEVEFGAPEWKLRGTLTLPSGTGPHPAVILVHGSGPNDRDETVGANKPFRDLAWGLAARHIAVLRYDKRTHLYRDRFLSNPQPITTREEATDDAGYALAFLRQRKEIAPDRIFLLGHSLGGMLAPRIAREHPGLAGLVLLAPSGRPLTEIMVGQMEYLAQTDGTVTVEEEEQIERVRRQAEEVAKLSERDSSRNDTILGAPPSYWLDLRSYDAPGTATMLDLPMLLLHGGRDYQVTDKDITVWRSALRNKKRVQFKAYPRLNHLFMTGQGPSTPAEYQAAAFVAEEVIEDIAEWVNSIPH